MSRRETLDTWVIYKDLPYAWLLIFPEGGARINIVMYMNCVTLLYSKDLMEWMSLETKKKILEQKAKEIQKNLTTFRLVTK